MWLELGGAALAGVVVGVVLTLVLRSRRRREPVPQVEPSVTPEIPAYMDDVLGMLRMPTVIVGPHDEVLRSSVHARTFGLVRGSRVGIEDLLTAVRDCRQDGRNRTVDIDIRRTISAPGAHLIARVARTMDGLVLIVAEDHTQARRVDETRRDFVANVSHELKTPIGAIGLLAEAVEQGADDPVAVRHFATKMQKEATRLSDLVTQIIGLSRLQSDDPILRATEVEIDDVIREAVARCATLAGDRNVNITVRSQGGKVLGDQAQLVDAFTNLVQNALVYSDPGARVAIAARRTVDDGDESIDVAVSDNGIGISPENQDRIFERFYRVDYGRSRANGGTGLGLSIVRHIAAVHGGTVTVWSQLGQGSTFTVHLPAIPADHDPEEETR